mgnify:CR=1 FL=1
MKKLFSIVLMMFCALTISAQTDVTTFLGIPVDGFKADMRKKLIAKGFTPKTVGENEFLEGEFNGRDVYVHIVTNNNKVYRIMVTDKNATDEAQIKIRFNNLCYQFEKNERYFTPEDFAISEDEDISYEMSVQSKLYSATYFQKPNSESIDALNVAIYKEMESKYTEEQLQNPTEEMEKEYDRLREKMAFELFSQKTVWFLINEYGGEYYIAMYYDNEYNKANGEDL